MNSKNSFFEYLVLRMASIKDKHWFGFNYVFDDSLGYLKEVVFSSNWDASQNTETREGRVAQQCWKEASMRRWDQANWFFNHLRIDQRQTTSHSPYTVEMKKRSFDVSDLEGANDGFFSWSWNQNYIATVDNFLAARATFGYIWFLLIPTSIKASGPFLVYYFQ